MSLLRCSMSAAHTTEQIDRILQIFAEIHPLITSTETSIDQGP